jgi:hypothetical protein
VVSEFGVWYEDWEAFDAGYAFSVGAHFGYVYFVFFVYFDWDFASAAFVLGVSWSSLSWTNRTFLSFLFSTFEYLLLT